MAISLGSLYVELTVNTGQFLDGMTKAATNARAFGRDIETGFNKMGKLFAPLGEMGERLAAVFGMVGSSARGALAEIGHSGALVGGLGALTGGAAALGGTLFALAEHASEAGSKIYDASQKTGISAAQMSGLMAVAKEMGGDFDSLSTSLARAGANLTWAIINPGDKAGKVLNQAMGGAKQLADEGMKPLGDRVQDVLKHIFEMNDAGERNLALSALLGRGWMANVTTLKILAEQGFGPAEAAARRMGIFFDDEGARQAKQFQVSIKELTAEFAGVALTIGKTVLPAFEYYVEGLARVGALTQKLNYISAQVGAFFAGDMKSAIHFSELAAAIGDGTQAQTDFMVRIANLAVGEKAASEETKGLTRAVKDHTDALASLIDREREQLALAGAEGNAAAKIGVEYQHAVEEIHKLTAAGGDQKEAVIALGLAWDTYVAKMQKLGPRPQLMFQEPPAGPKPLAQLPLGGQATPQAPGYQVATPAEWASLRGNMGNLAAAAKALRKEEDLSTTSLMRLSAAFPGLDMNMIAAEASGRRMIEALTKRDQFGSFGEQWKETIDKLVSEGDNFGGKFLAVMTQTLDQVENKFAQLAVKGKANFRELLPQMEQGLVKSGLQTGVSMFLKGTGLGGAEKMGTAGNPVHVVMDSLSGMTGGLTGSAGMASSVEHGMLGVFSKIFGGFMAEGGDVGAGHAYVVGEHGPEFFMPRVHGSIAPQGAGGGAPMVVHNHFNITTPDADSFRRSQSAIMSDAYAAAARAKLRNS